MRKYSARKEREVGGIIVLLSFLVLGSIAVLAQLPTATILGTVKDSSGAVLPKIAVSVTNLEQHVIRTVTTGDDGAYRIPALPVGSYEIRVSGEGFKTITRTGVVLTVNQDATLNFNMEVGARTEIIRVNAEVPQVDTASSQLGSLVSEQNINDLPLNGRNFVDLTLLQPGVTQHIDQFYVAGNAGTIFVVNGGTTRSNNFMLDGAIMQNFYGLNASSVNSTTLGAEGIKEYQVVTNLFGAQYGMTMGSQTTIVSKSGSNQLHGSAFEYVRNDILNARNYFDELYTLPTTTPGGGRRIEPFKRNQFGGSLGGPIKKDKTFIFGTYETVHEVIGEPTLDTVFPKSDYSPVTHQLLATGNPDAVGPLNPNGVVNPTMVPFLQLYPYPNVGNNEFQYLGFQRTTENYGQARFDQNFSSSDSFFTRYTIDNTFQYRPGSYPQREDTWSNRSQYVTLSETHIFTPTLLNTARFSVSRTGMTVTSTTGTYPGTSFVKGQGFGILDIGISGVAVTEFGTDISPGFHKQNIYTLSDDLFWTKGKHALKFGTLLNKFGDGIQEDYFLAGYALFANNFSFFNGDALYFTQAIGGKVNQNRYYRFDTYGFYAQDDYRASSRLTLNLGLRYEFLTEPQDMNGRGWRTLNILTASSTTNPALAPAAGWTQGPLFQNNSLHNFSPRVGFAWDVLGKGKTALRGGFGIYYDVGNIGSVMCQGVLGTPPLVSEYVGGGPITIPLTYAPGAIANSVITQDYYAKQPYMLQYDLSVQQQLPAGTALTVAYIGSRGIHLWGGEGTPNPNKPIGWESPGVPIFPAPNPFVTFPTLNPNLASSTIDLSTHADSWYNGLQVTATNRMRHGLQFTGSYTWSKLLDDTQNQLSGADGTADYTDPFDSKFDKGPAGFDVKHLFSGTMTYRVPDNHWNNIGGRLLKGWQVSNIVTIESGYPFSVFDTSNNSNAGFGPTLGSDRADVVTSSNLAYAQAINPGAVVYNPNTVAFGKLTPLVNDTITNPDGSHPTQLTWFNFNMFTSAPGGYLGDSRRGMLRGPGLVNWNFSLRKDTHLAFLGEAGKLQFRAEFFNLINRTNLGLPSSEGIIAPVPVEGIVGGTASSMGNIFYANPAREIQFAVRLGF